MDRFIEHTVCVPCQSVANISDVMRYSDTPKDYADTIAVDTLSLRSKIQPKKLEHAEPWVQPLLSSSLYSFRKGTLTQQNCTYYHLIT